MLSIVLIVLVIRLYIFPVYTEARNNNKANKSWIIISPLADQSPITKITKTSPLLFSPVPSSLASHTPRAGTNGLLAQINAYRVEFGLGKVIENETVCAFARLRVREVAENFSHQGFQNRIAAGTLPYPSFSRVTENLAKTGRSENVVPMWIDSSGHAENMRADTPYVCVARFGEYYVYEGWKS